MTPRLKNSICNGAFLKLNDMRMADTEFDKKYRRL